MTSIQGQDQINQLFNSNSKAFGDTTEQHYQDGTYKRGEVFLNQAKVLLGKKEAYILDYGCGTGRISMMLGQEGFSVTGVDPAAEHIDIAKSLNTFKHVNFKLLHDKLAEADGVFDAVVSSSVLEFVPDVDFYLQEMYRVLKPGGIVLISVPNIFSLWRLYSKIRFGKQYKHFDFQKNVLSQSDVKTLFRKHKFQSLGSSVYFESAFDHKGLSVLNKSMFFGTLMLLQFVKK